MPYRKSHIVDGRRQRYGNYLFWTRTPKGIRVLINTLSDNKTTADVVEALVDTLREKARSGEALGPDLTRRAENQPQQLLVQLVRHGFLENRHTTGMRPLEQHVEAWVDALRDKGTSKKTSRVKGNSVLAFCRDMEVTNPAEITQEALEEFSKQLQKRDKSTRTRAEYVQCVKQFCLWMVRKGFMAESPVRWVKRPEVVPVRPRRAESPENIQKLIWAAYAGQDYSAGTGANRVSAKATERGLIYWFLAESGMRVAQAQRLSVGDFVLNAAQPYVIVRKAPQTKAKRDNAVALINPMLNRALEVHFRGRSPKDDAFSIRFWPQALRGRVLRADMENAGIPRVLAGEVFDWHCFRHTRATHASNAGVTMATLSSMLGHLTSGMTQRYYIHHNVEEQARQFGRAPKFDGPPAPQEGAA